MNKAALFCTLAFCAALLVAQDFPRAQPLLNVDAPEQVFVSDFGALPGDGKNAADAINAALKEAAVKGGAAVIFEKGVYRVKAVGDGKGQSVLTLKGAKNVIIEGNGATLVCETPLAGVLQLYECENVIVRNFTIDYDPLPFSVGKVISAFYGKSSGVIVETLKGYPDMHEKFFADAPACWGYVLDPKNKGRPASGLDNAMRVQKIEKISEADLAREFRERGMSSRGSAETPLGRGFEVGERGAAGLSRIFFREGVNVYVFKPGMLFTLNARAITAVVDQVFTKNTTMQNIEIYAGNSGNFTSAWGDANNFINCRIVIKEGRLRSSNADGFHIQNSLTGPWIEGCRVEGTGDDAVNIYSTPDVVFEIADPKTFSLSRGAGRGDKIKEYSYRVGDEVVFYIGDTGEILGAGKVAEVDLEGSRIILESGLESTGKFPVGLDKLFYTSVYNMSRSNAAVIRKNEFKNFRGNGVFLKARNVLIEENLIDGASTSGIIMCDIPGSEGLFCESVTVRNNRFVDAGYDSVAQWQPDMASVIIKRAQRELADDVFAHKNIVIENNTFEGWRRHAILIKYAQGVTVGGNKFGKSREAGKGLKPNESVLKVQNVKGFEMKSNQSSAAEPFISK